MSADYRIDPEFSCLCPMLSDEERDGLRASLKAHGCREPLVVWKEEGLLLDGHNRELLCRELEVPFKVVSYSFPDRDAARNWIIDNALARRNLNEEQRRFLRGMRLLSEKRQGARNDLETSPQSEAKSGKTAGVIAKREGVSRATVERDAEYARAVNRIGETAGPKVKRAILSGKVKLTREQVARAAAKGVQTMTALRKVAKSRAAPAPKLTNEDKLASLASAAVRLAGEIAKFRESKPTLTRKDFAPFRALRDEIAGLEEDVE